MSNRIAWGIVWVMASTAVWGQGKAAEFEVASVKQNTADDRIVRINVGPGGRFAARGYTLVLLIQRAYGVMDWNVSEGPSWIRTDRWDVEAKANVAGNLAEAELQPMLQRLLADRFKLKLHRSSKEMSGYALEVAKDGPKLKPSANAEPERDSFRFSSTELSGQGVSMPDVARFVAGKLGLVGVDQTGLKGLYEFHAVLKVEADPAASALPDSDPREALRLAVFSALQNQLGLKMTAKKIAVDMLVIDSVEKASKN